MSAHNRNMKHARAIEFDYTNLLAMLQFQLRKLLYHPHKGVLHLGIYNQKNCLHNWKKVLGLNVNPEELHISLLVEEIGCHLTLQTVVDLIHSSATSKITVHSGRKHAFL